MNECLRCGRLPGNSHTEICALQGEMERLRHDIERHIKIASELATENERLRAELAEARKPDCRLCVHLQIISGAQEFECGFRTSPCVAGSRFCAINPVRLYEKEGEV